MSFIIRIAIYLILLTLPVNSEEIYKPDFSRFLKIELVKSENKKFITNLIKAASHEENGDSLIIKQQYKKWFNGYLTLKEKKITKKYKIKLRIMGDFKDHLQMDINRMSLKIKLIDDTIGGIRIFRLFLPITRQGTNEIYANLLFSKIGFPTLFTKMVNVSFLDQEYKAIFQEAGSKEFLERNGLSEVPIIKVGEIGFDINTKYERDRLTGINYINNSSGILKKSNSIDTINEAIYLANSKNFKNIIFNNKFFEEILSEIGPHGLAAHNRKFIYLPVNRIFIPLYYDGNISYDNIIDLRCDIRILDLDIKNFIDEYEYLSEKKITTPEICYFKKIFNIYKKDIKNKNYFSILPLTNVEVFPEDHIKNIIKIRNIYLKSLQNSYRNENRFLDQYLIQNKKSIEKCYYSNLKEKFEYCENISISKYKPFLHSRPQFNNFKNNQTLTMNVGKLELLNKITILNKKDLQKEKILLDKPHTYYIDLKEISKEKIFLFDNFDSRLVLIGEKDEVNYKFYLSQRLLKNTIPKIDRTNGQLITGCVTFYNVKIKNAFLSSKNLFCEDSINFLYSELKINNLEIFNSPNDAVDADFSKIKFDNINILNAGNDCIDFSFGDYHIENGEVHNCNDKAFSFGEMSNGKVNNIKIYNSKDAIVSKDSSKVFIQSMFATGIKNFCLAAYNKKTEFDGGYLNAKNIICDNKNFKDKHSEIVTYAK